VVVEVVMVDLAVAVVMVECFSDLESWRPRLPPPSLLRQQTLSGGQGLQLGRPAGV
jgi:hypothetical protein